jgi:FkbM family methyltransferase
VVLDVGSNTGVYALTAKAVNPTATVVAFEPNPPTFERLVANVELNKFDIVTSDFAVSNQNGNAVFYAHTAEQLASLESTDGQVSENGKQITVKTTRLDDFADSHGLTKVDLIKIDIEGHEPMAFDGAQRTLAASRPALLVEVLTGDVGDELWRRLEPLGYEAYRIFEQRGLARVAKPGGQSWQARNCLFCPGGTIERHGLLPLVLESTPDETRPRRSRKAALSRCGLGRLAVKPLVGEVSPQH